MALDQAQPQGQDIDLSALSYATTTGFNDIVAELLYRGREHLTREHASGALWIAVANQHENIAELLLTGKANSDLRDDEGDTPLLWAAIAGNKEMVELLLSTGKANPDVSDNDGNTPLFSSLLQDAQKARMARYMDCTFTVSLGALLFVRNLRHSPVNILYETPSATSTPQGQSVSISGLSTLRCKL
ncbi:hypothetical protein GGTG_00290 [Gaeumannomyces tritici R3-111a-1]|uniref:Uncharacterized protein n=1 Tax=Gaeumannomyces tritici (strain R3-111a-1) TaxID=644352 RepID=J3NG98_GAET3|nr:hypothetical protein GGTG_00290 [Gaeumannomyces tritici R3-111a-1]EJT80288.1 hypothetical protein GGTG_00290 [Gaeumannomyces tritici R3-111a-1]